ncbi:hypothetical protein EDB86DRAFT_336017 [Lactarius hatsudake]|nr:hypothetical protein EDB86DRAFT_336017 [Lactarius hatsudake]
MRSDRKNKAYCFCFVFALSRLVFFYFISPKICFKFSENDLLHRYENGWAVERLTDEEIPGSRWHMLLLVIHVCRGWRRSIFASSRCLDLQLICTVGTPMRKYLGCWPPTLPIVINYTPPPTLSTLFTLTKFRFKESCKYLEDLVASISFFREVVFDVPQLTQLFVTQRH